jgi:hypothetical protein
MEELIFENRRIVIPDLFGALRLSMGTQHCPRKKELGLHRVKTRAQMGQTRSVFPEYNEK